MELVLLADNASDWDNDIRFGGARLDPETGLYICGWKMYHPALGRDLQRDPSWPGKVYGFDWHGGLHSWTGTYPKLSPCTCDLKRTL